ncbi:phosphatase 2C-like domain-containing protein [Dunaliella salina]|uniref:Protein phosphatase n=1 Tax=Dunaliella salina TaxID=3046 RepID=A0ABQ7H8A7_DUNSA|nr:phosphatase 2C-like domain-containing protein [Dunaliella salina]|eukprot:KAF5843088.1 phosphatase 2C-like domain-containing protein [Dunaliella salina]
MCGAYASEQTWVPWRLHAMSAVNKNQVTLTFACVRQAGGMLLCRQACVMHAGGMLLCRQACVVQAGLCYAGRRDVVVQAGLCYAGRRDVVMHGRRDVVCAAAASEQTWVPFRLHMMWAGKNKPQATATFACVMQADKGGCYLCCPCSNPGKVAADKGGEDAYCICNAGLGAIGVADGVSGWAEEGIDPAEYSRTLMRHCELAIEAAGTEAQGREVIRDAHQKTVMAGSSTVCLALMKPEGRLEVVNLGDSGVRVIREGMVAFASAAQQHMFNMPFQLSHPSIIESPDDADSASANVVDVQPGDVIVLATDGLYDNMFDEEIARLCGDYMNRRRKSMRLLGNGDKPPTAAELAAAAVAQARQQQFTSAEAGFLAQEIARLAHCYAHDPCRRTPWSVASCEQGFSWANYFADGGGKMDDCTVVIAFVQPESPQ